MIVDHVRPFVISYMTQLAGKRVDTVFHEPMVCVEEVVLFAPQHARHSLADYAKSIFAQARRRNVAIELVGLGDARLKKGFDVLEG